LALLLLLLLLQNALLLEVEGEKWYLPVKLLAHLRTT
jgi:hypothetical protein